jgi:hypothetical protein
LVEAAAVPEQKSMHMGNEPPIGISGKSPRLLVFDITEPTAPDAGDTVVLGPNGADFTGVAVAADGLVVVGNAVRKDDSNEKWLLSGESFQSLRVVAVEPAGSPLLRPVIDLPGELFAVTDLDRDGFLAWTRRSSADNAAMVQVSACDGFDAFAVTGLEVPARAVVTAGGRRLFVATKDGVERNRLTAAGGFSAESTLDSGWRPDALRWIDGTLTGSRWNALFVADDKDGVVTRWKFPTWNPGVEHIVLTDDGGVLAPFGEYGVQRLER